MPSDGRWTGAGLGRDIASRFTFNERGGVEPKDKAEEHSNLESQLEEGFRFMVKLKTHFP